MRTKPWLSTAALISIAARAQVPHDINHPDTSKLNTEHAVYFSGKVMMDDGTPPVDPVRLERVCDGRISFAAWTDNKGVFSFKVSAGDDSGENQDASHGDQTPDSAHPLGAGSTAYTNAVTASLRGCQLQAVFPGYQSERVSIDIKSVMDSSRLGTIILHPISRASALTVSVTSLAAPVSAKKSYEKGLEAMRLQKWDAAAAELQKAVKTYPNFATAWYQLGLVRQSQNDAAGALQAWKQSQEIDPEYVKPYENLTLAADRRGDFAESEKYSRLWLQLDPEDFPGAWLLNAVANARLNKPEDAERAAREGIRIDKDQKLPRLYYVLGLILMGEKKYAGSAQCFHKYLDLAPNAGDAPIVRQQIPQIEQMAATTHEAGK